VPKSHNVTELPAAPKQDKWFYFRIPEDEKTYRLPRLEYLRRHDLEFYEQLVRLVPKMFIRDKKTGDHRPRKDVKDSDLLAADLMQRRLLDHYAPGVLDRLHDEQLAYLWKAWGEASAVTSGESSAS
jgi:hypothetical protein